jgi:hypothetical protein
LSNVGQVLILVTSCQARGEKVTAVSNFRFLAFLTLDAALAEEPLRLYPSGSHDLMIRSSRLDEPAVRRYFTASIYPGDEQPLHPGDTGVLTAIEVTDKQACAFLGPGQHITLWNGHECGHGVICRRLVSPETG